MKLFGRLMKHTPKVSVAPMRGLPPEESQARQDVMRNHMEAEVAADRKKRGATDVRPAGDHDR
jgi:hypothetical protein